MSNLSFIVLPAPVAGAALNLLTFQNKKAISTPEEFMEEDGYPNTPRYEKYNTERFSNEDFICIGTEKENIESILPFLDDWKDITEYPDTYKAEHGFSES